MQLNQWTQLGFIGTAAKAVCAVERSPARDFPQKEARHIRPKLDSELALFGRSRRQCALSGQPAQRRLVRGDAVTTSHEAHRSVDL